MFKVSLLTGGRTENSNQIISFPVQRLLQRIPLFRRQLIQKFSVLSFRAYQILKKKKMERGRKESKAHYGHPYVEIHSGRRKRF